MGDGTTRGWPQPLHDVSGPMRATKFAGIRAGMGDAAPATVELLDSGFVSPDVVCGLTLFLLSNQPRTARLDAEGKATATDGGVWVREQFTWHRPLPSNDAFTVTGASTGRYVRRGRRYGTTVSQTRSSSGELVATNMTTGLLAYRVEEGLADEVVGIPYDETPVPEPDHERAAENPHRSALAAVVAEESVLGGDPILMSLDMMAARDTDRPDNPIHSDPDKARAAGLDRPIAGGSHVLAFALEPILAEWGPGVLSHGACIDVRWKAPTRCDVVIVPTATVTALTADSVSVDLRVALADDVTAMEGTVVIPR